MTFLELVQQLHRDVGTDGASPTTVSGQSGMNAKLVGWVQTAVSEIDRRYQDWHYLYAEKQWTTVSGTAEYALDGALDLESTLYAWDDESFVWKPTDDDYAVLERLDYHGWRMNERLGTVSSGTPSSFVLTPANDVVLYPTPASASIMRANYWRRSVALTVDEDVPLMPAPHHRCIVLLAKIYYAESEAVSEIYEAAHRELFGDQNSGMIGEMDRLEASQLPGQEFRARAQMSRSSVSEMVARPE